MLNKRYLATFLVGLAATLLFTPLEALADDRALIVGVGRYRNARLNLAGIGLDVDMMVDTAKRLGFRKIKRLENRDATVAKTSEAIKRFLGGAGSQDRVLLYFSGHGTNLRDRNGDEPDGRDEALVMYEASGGKQGLLIDDDLGKMLRNLKAKKVVMIIDACHSGSVYKSYNPLDVADSRDVEDHTLGLEGHAQTKFVTVNDEDSQRYAQSRGWEPRARTSEEEATTGREARTDAHKRLVAYTAAQDDEQAIASRKGSIFTLGLYHALRDAGKGGSIGYEALADKISRYVSDRNHRFHPQLFVGPAVRSDGGLQFGRQRRRRPGRDRVLRAVDHGIGIKVRTNTGQEKYRIGENLVVEVDIPRAGYVNIVFIDPDDKMGVMFPNKFDENNYVKKGRLRIPTSSMKFDLATTGPKGPNTVAVFLTKEKVNFRKDATGPRGLGGLLKESIGNEVSYSSLKGFEPVQRSRQGRSRYHAGSIELEVVD